MGGLRDYLIKCKQKSPTYLATHISFHLLERYFCKEFCFDYCWSFFAKSAVTAGGKLQTFFSTRQEKQNKMIGNRVCYFSNFPLDLNPKLVFLLPNWVKNLQEFAVYCLVLKFALFIVIFTFYMLVNFYCKLYWVKKYIQQVIKSLLCIFLSVFPGIKEGARESPSTSTLPTQSLGPDRIKSGRRKHLTRALFLSCCVGLLRP